MTKHVHYDKIVEWAADPSVQWQHRSGEEWVDSYSVPSWSEVLEYRKKPREFKEGYWYPVRDRGGLRFILMYTSGIFWNPTNGKGYYDQDFKFIGEGFLPDFGETNE